MNKGEGTAEKAVDVLIAMFDSQDIRSELDDATRNGIREIGQSLYEAGGMDLMLAAHEMFEAQRRLWARTLEMQWDGIGGWWG